MTVVETSGHMAFLWKKLGPSVYDMGRILSMNKMMIQALKFY